METEELKLDIRFSDVQNKLFFPDEAEGFPKFTIVRKGRRSGFTRGAAQAIILYSLSEDFWFLPKGPLYILWVETIHGNIQRYFDRYFLPVLQQLEPGQWQWNQQQGVLKVGRSTIDMRSSERPENIVGYGYQIQVINEAGHILENDYLFSNILLPMTIDFKDSKMIIGGSPTGKRTVNGIHKFYELYQTAQHNKIDYRIIKMTGRMNPFIVQSELEAIANAMDDATRRQEIEGEFCDTSERRFLYAFNESHIIPSYEPNPHLPILASFDFNKDPMTCVIAQSINPMTSVVFDEIEMQVGSTVEVCEQIRDKYKRWFNSRNIDVTGDATGRNRSALTRGNLNHYRVIKTELALTDRNLLVPRSNPALKDSRVLCNSVLQNAKHSITANCERTINDLFTANVDADGELVKNAKIGLHLFDGWRYFIEATYPEFITNPGKYS